MNLKELSEKYYLSSDFSSLADKTKVDYQYCCSRLLDTKVDGNLMAKIIKEEIQKNVFPKKVVT